METEYYDSKMVQDLIEEIKTNSEGLVLELEDAKNQPVPIKFHSSIRLNKSSINGLIAQLKSNLDDLKKLKPMKC